jgi:hypothetical protein
MFLVKSIFPCISVPRGLALRHSCQLTVLHTKRQDWKDVFPGTFHTMSFVSDKSQHVPIVTVSFQLQCMVIEYKA